MQDQIKTIFPSRLKVCFICMVFIMFYIPLRAQNILRPMEIGDTLPSNSVFMHIVNGKKKMLLLDDIKEKALVIDFWADWCTVCLENMPEMAAFQDLYGNELEIIYVSYQKEKEVTNFYKKHSDLALLNLPICTEDTFFSSLFPYKSLPHVVWVDKNRIIRAITKGSEINKKNLSCLINEPSNLKLPVKHDLLWYEYRKPFALLGLGYCNIDKYSVLTSDTKGLQSRMGITYLDSNHVRVSSTNSSLRNLLLFACKDLIGNEEYNFDYRIFLSPNGSDSIYYFDDTSDYCYEMIVKVPDKNNKLKYALSYMREDLALKLGLVAKIVEKPITCYFISRNNKIVKRDTASLFIKDDIDTLSLKHISIHSCIPFINQYLKDSHYPLLVDNTEIEKISLQIPKHGLTPLNLKAMLEKAGWNIEKTTKKTKILLLSENKIL